MEDQTESPQEQTPKRRARRGFALLAREQVRALGIAGGKAVQAQGTGHRFTPDEAREAAKKSAFVRRQRRRASR